MGRSDRKSGKAALRPNRYANHIKPISVARLQNCNNLARFFVICLAAVVTWHFVYIPLHLLAHDHIDGSALHHTAHTAATSPHELCTHDRPDPDDHHDICDTHSHENQSHHSHDDHGHEPHPASDHLSGFWSIATPAMVIEPIQHTVSVVPQHTVTAPAIAVSRAHLRGPPA